MITDIDNTLGNISISIYSNISFIIVFSVPCEEATDSIDSFLERQQLMFLYVIQSMQSLIMVLFSKCNHLLKDVLYLPPNT